MSSLEATEKECAANATAPRVSLADIQDNIKETFYVLGSEALAAFKPTPKEAALLTVCFVIMRNGFVILGKSAPASPENFNQELGRKLAYEDAVRQIWPLMGFSLRDRLAAA